MATSSYHNKNIIATVFLILLTPLEVSRLRRLSMLLGIGLLTGLTLLPGSVYPVRNFIISNEVYASTQEASTRSSVCGDGVKESGEQCDGSDLAGASCTSQGYTGGTLSCSASCTFNTSACTSGGGGGGGGGGGVTIAPETGITISGYAYPGLEVTLLKDAQVALVTTAGMDGRFNASLIGLSAGSYIFSVYSEGRFGTRSALFSFPVIVTSGATARVSGIFIPPTLRVDKSQVKKGDDITFFGTTTPGSLVNITVNSFNNIILQTNANDDGVYLQAYNTSELDKEEHTVQTRAVLNGQLTSNSKVVTFVVGDSNITQPTPHDFTKADLNDDGRVNIVDFSIAAYWYKRLSPPASVDLNTDGKVDIVDFSIMAYNWTG